MDEKWIGETPSPQRASVMLVAILSLSNDAEATQDPFERRLRLNEMQAAIRSAKQEIEAFAEGLIFLGDGHEGEPDE